MSTAYLAHPDFQDDLAEELARGRIEVDRWHDRLAITRASALPSVWAANIWHDVEEVEIGSIGSAATTLMARQRNWAMFAPQHRGRAKLIADRLPHVSAKPLTLGQAPPSGALGSWTLLAPDRMLLAGHCSSPFLNGEPKFVEDRVGPPNRAYLKLWEALVRIGRWPGAGDRCVDLGASPGGWTWSIAQLGASVLAIDKAPLDSAVAALPRVRWQRGSAFAVEPADVGDVDWVFSDVIAYPDRIHRVVERWMESGLVDNIVCTIKLQGATDHDEVDRFVSIPGGQVVHLFHNKHELTFAATDLRRPSSKADPGDEGM